MRKLVFRLIVAIPLVVLLVGAGLFVLLQVKNASGKLGVLLVDELERMYKRDVRIGKITTQPFGSAVIEDFEISDQDKKGTFLKSDKIVIKYDWVPMLLRKLPPVQTVRSVTLVSPTVYLERNRSGKWNFSDFIRKPVGPPKPPFLGKIVVKDGTVILRDYQARVAAPKPAVNRFSRIAGIIDASGSPDYTFQVEARGTKGRLGDVAVEGTIYGKQGKWNIDIAANDAAAAYWTKYQTSLGTVNITKGRVDASINLTYEKVNGKPKWSYIGSAGVRDAQIAFNGIRGPVSKVNGRARFTPDVATIDAKGNVANSPFALKGSIVNFRKPRLNLEARSKSADFVSIVRILPSSASLSGIRLSGKGPLKLRIQGNLNDPQVNAETRIPLVTLYGRTGRDVSVRAVYNKKRVVLEDVSGSALGGSFTVNGTIVLAKPVQLNLGGSLKSIDLASLPLPRGTKLSGQGSGAFSIAGTTSQPVVSASVQVSSGNYNNIVFSNALAYLDVQGNQVRVRQADLSVMGGSVTASGTVTGQKLDMSLVARGLSLQKISGFVGERGYRGALFYRGKLTGTTSNPVLAGNAEVFEGQFQNYAFDYAKGTLILTRDGLEFQDAVVRVFPGEATVRGNITRRAGRPLELDLTVKADRLQASRILRMLKVAADIEGKVRGDIHVFGAGKDITAEGNIFLEEGSVGGIPVSAASAEIIYSNNSLQINNAQAQSDNALLTANGVISTQGLLAIDFKVENLAMARLNEYTKPYAEVTGTLTDVSGKLSGALSSPDVSITASAGNVTINEVHFDSMSMTASWIEGVLKVEKARLAQGETEYAIDSAEYNTKTKNLSAQGDLSQVSIEQIVTAVSRSPYLKSDEAQSFQAVLDKAPKPLAGVLNVSFSASGPVNALDASVNGAVSNLKVGAVDVDSVQANIKLQDGSVSVEDFSAVSKELNVNVRPGVVYANGALNLDFTVANVDAAVLAPYIRPLGVAGSVTVDAIVTGSPKAPTVTASVEMEDPVISGVEFDRLRASRIAFTQDKVDISDVILSKGSHQMVLYGMLPWDWNSLGIPKDKPVDFHAEFKNQSLALLNVLTNEVKAEGTSGTIDASLTINGTFSNPITNGSFNIKDGNIALRQTDAVLKDIQASLQFDGENVKVNQFKMASSLGGTIAIDPEGIVSLRNFPDGDINLALVAENFRFKETDLAGYKESISAILNSRLTVTGPLKSPLIAGNVDAREGTIIIPPIAAAQRPAEKKYTVDPRFDVKVNLGQDVWFRNPRVVARTPGSVTINGTLSKPNVKARLTVAEGYIRLPTARLRLVKGGTVDLVYAPPDDVKTSLNVQGRTTTTAVSALGVRRQYEIVMTVKGPLDDMDIDLKSTPGDLSNQRMLALLGHVEDIFAPGDLALKQDLTDVFTTLAGGAVLQPLETAVSEALGLQEFRVEFAPGEPTAVFLSRELVPNLSVSYWRSLNAIDEDYFVRLSYQLTDKYAVSLTQDDQHESTLEANVIFRF